MKLTQITNACCIYEQDGYKILCDPWLTPGAFYGSWFHERPLKTRPQDVADYDLLYISHLHPDHFDQTTLEQFDKQKPVVILDRKPNYLERMLRSLGFNNLHKLEDGRSRIFGPFHVHMLGPFCGHPFFTMELGNPIDSAIVVESKGQRILNTNDNTPDVKACRVLKERFGHFDIAQMNYNAAGPYPSAFTNLSRVTQREASKAIVKRQLELIIECLRVLSPNYFQPFAGQFVLGGRFIERNSYLGTVTAEFAAGFIEMFSSNQRTLVLQEQESFDLGESLIDNKYGYLKQQQFPYDSLPMPMPENIHMLCAVAQKHLEHKQAELNCYPDVNVIVNGFKIDLTRDRLGGRYVIQAVLDPRLLDQILRGDSHWNNAEIGGHITFHREPNLYLPDVHLLMSYFHVPKRRLDQ